MELSSDINLTHPLWSRADNELCNNNEIGIFNRLVDVYVIACAIGIHDDKTISYVEEQDAVSKSIGRSTHRENDDLRTMLEFMLQNALLHSKTIKYDMDERLKLAFDPTYNVKNFSAASFLTGFANYGLEQIFNKIDSKSSLVVVSEIYDLLEGMTAARYDEILKQIALDIDNS